MTGRNIKEKEAPESGKGFGVFTTRDFAEDMAKRKGNNTTYALMHAIEEQGISATLQATAHGYIIKAEGREIFLQDAYTESEYDFPVFGFNMPIESMRLPWFRKALGKAFGYDSDDSLFESLLKDEIQHPHWARGVYLQLRGFEILDEDTIMRLREANNSLRKDPMSYVNYFRKVFEDAFPPGFSIMGPDNPLLYPKTVKALWSIVNEDKDFKDAISAAKVVAERIIRDTRERPEEQRKTIYEVDRKIRKEQEEAEKAG